MQQAISIYLGGEIVTPEVCSHDSYKKLGLKCPFCQSPVFYRQASQYRSKNKEIFRKACFSHFEIDKVVEQVCEARSLTTEGKQEIENIQRKSRNQRLRLFEQHLIDLMSLSVGVKQSKEELKSKTKKIQKVAGKVITYLAKVNLKTFREQCLDMKNAGWEQSIVSYLEGRGKSSKHRAAIESRFGHLKADRIYQERVFEELFSYLSERCSEHQYQKLINFYLVCLIDSKVIEDSKEREPKEWISMVQGTLEAFDKYAELVPGHLLVVNWREAINQFNPQTLSPQ